MSGSLVFGAVIFDLDGLALDTESGYRMAWRRTRQPPEPCRSVPAAPV